MLKSELIAALQRSIAAHGDGRVLHDLDVGDSIIVVSQFDEVTAREEHGEDIVLQPGDVVLL